jgi:myo-inositol-1(or 4)-monophosphatase
MFDIKEAISKLVPEVEACGQDLLKMHAELSPSSSKGGVDLVTKADHQSENVLYGCLRRMFPDHSIVAEEGSKHQGNDWCWHLDPLDGTANYSRRLPEWCISLGLSFAARPVAGIIVAPQLGTTWSGGGQFGVMCNGAPCARAHVPEGKESWLVGYDHPWDPVARSSTLQLIAAMATEVRMPSSRGSAALALGYLCSGQLDAYVIKKAYSWDFCAGAAMAMALGYEVLDWSGRDYDLRSNEMLACRPSMSSYFKAVIEKTFDE